MAPRHGFIELQPVSGIRENRRQVICSCIPWKDSNIVMMRSTAFAKDFHLSNLRPFYTMGRLYPIPKSAQEGEMMIRQPKVSYFIAGMVLMLALMLLTGADRAPVDHVGRYRLSVTVRGSFTDMYVIDTATGVVKYLGKDEGKPFDQVGGK